LFSCWLLLIGEIPPLKRGPWLFAYYGKLVYTGIGEAGINGYAVFGTVVMIPGFIGGFTVVKYPADFEFPLFRNKRGIFENF
jgi:hypothetical protein